jgi:ABC-type transport system involved in multi-copper enzyme maturation permease subunit
MAGLSNWMHWVGWMVNSLIVLLITITIITFLLFVPFWGKTGTLGNSDFTLWWFFLFLYIIWATTYCFLISSIFEKRKHEFIDKEGTKIRK